MSNIFTQEQREQILSNFWLGKINAYHFNVFLITKSITATLLFCQIRFWLDTKRKEGQTEFFKTNEEFCKEIGMGINEFKAAKKILQDLGLINVEIRGVPPKSYYSSITKNVNDKIFELDENLLKSMLNPAETLNWLKINQSIGCESTNQLAENQPIDRLKISQLYKEAKSTTKITTNTLAQISEKTEQNQPVAVLKENGVCVQDINQENQENSQETPIKHNYSEAFLKWWDIYPKKLSKESAYSAYKKTIKRINPKDLNVRTEIYVELEKHLDPQFIPYPGSWLNAGRWMDEGVEKQFELQKQKITPDKIDMESFLPRESGPWRSVLEDLYKNIGKPAYLSWIKGNLDPIPETSLKLLKIENNTAYLQAATGFIVDKLKNDYDKDIKSAIVKNYAGVQNIEICKSC